LATLAGQEMVAAEKAELPDLKALHPRGEERFDETDQSQRWEANLHHNTLVSTIRKGLAAPVDKE
jgi:hypothetical protein